MTNLILEKALRLFSVLKFEGLADVANGRKRPDKTETAVFKIAMMIAALDGCVTVDEINTFGKLAVLCARMDAEDSAAVLDEGLRVAGYVEIQARRLKEPELTELFVAEVRRLLPRGFAVHDSQRVRRALVLWMSMALSDGDYSPVERKCIRALCRHLSSVMKTSDLADRNAWRTASPMFVVAYSGDSREKSPVRAPDEEFLRQVETQLKQIYRGENTVAAFRNLKTMISGVR